MRVAPPKKRKRFITLGIALGIALTVIVANFIPSEKRIETRVEANYGVHDAQFIRAIGTLLGPPLIAGNNTTELVNGIRIFPAMLEAIRGAQKTITFETFIYWRGKVGRDFAEALAERARAGVKVHVLLDYVGSTRMEEDLLTLMREAGCEVLKFHPPKWYHLTRFNNRTHRKLLIVDGKVGFTGGVGIGEEWEGDAQDPQHWRDTHFRVEGPVVGQMQATFMVNWVRTSGRVEHDGRYFPPLPEAGTQYAQMFHSSPEEGSENIRLMYLLSLAAAKRSILLQQAYFLPDRLVTRMLVDAAKRGVRVEVIVPGPLTDMPSVRRASRGSWEELLKAGVKIYEYQPTNFHCKVMIVDGIWASVGSTNFDNRSFRLNDEANLNVYDTNFAQQLERTFEADKAESKEVTYAAWAARPWHSKLKERFWNLFRAQM